MPLNKSHLLQRIDALLDLGARALATGRKVQWGSVLDSALFNEFRSASLSFLVSCVGENHVYFREFNARTKDAEPSDVNRGCGILRALQSEVSADWLQTVRALLSADIFGDYLEMADHLLAEGYKDPGAVLVGGVLEGHLRNLATSRHIDLTYTSNGRTLRKTADTLNSELYKAAAYASLDQKSVVSWLDLRNRAAHGEYSKYTNEQVVNMLSGVRDFLLRVPA